MKRILLLSLCLVLAGVNGAFAFGHYEAPNGGNMSFYPLMQQQIEHQETLDFTKNPENYKQKREAKDAKNGTVVRNSGYNPSYGPNYGGTGLQQVHPVNMRFIKDANGNIKIQGMNSSNYSNTINTTTTEE
ncbi:hypothetical protein IJ579_05050 [bacterium]|nr:hypothetical protein [bacterium]